MALSAEPESPQSIRHARVEAAKELIRAEHAQFQSRQPIDVLMWFVEVTSVEDISELLNFVEIVGVEPARQMLMRIAALKVPSGPMPCEFGTSSEVRS